MVNRETRDRLIAEHPSSAEVLKPFLRGRDVKRWKADNPDLWLLFIPWHFPLHKDPTIEGASEKAEGEFQKQFPAVYNHLLKFKDQLSNRNQAETGIRYEWYVLQRCAATYWQEFANPKIIYPDIARNCEFSFDTNHFFPDCTLFIIPDVPLYLVGILNSKIIQFFFSQISPRVRGDFMRFKSIYVKQIPISKINSPQKFEAIVSYVQFINNYLNSLDSAQDKQMLSYFEQIINGLVYELYLPEDLHTAGCSIAAHLPTLAPIENLESLRSLFDRLSHPDHPLQRNLIQLQNLDLIKLIEGKH